MSKLKPIPIDGDDAARFVQRYEPLLLDGYRAYFSRDIRIEPPVFHYVITKESSPEILVWSQTHSLQEALAEAKKSIKTRPQGRSHAAEVGT